MSPSRRPRALLLDIGGVLQVSAHELMGVLGAARPELAAFTDVRGLLGPVPDEAWAEVLAGRRGERAYWADRAAEYAALVGDRSGRGVRALMDVLHVETPRRSARPADTPRHSARPADDPYRPEAIALMDDAHDAGLTVAALTNDLTAFQGEVDFAAHPVLGRFDAIVDGAVTGVLKPDPRAFAYAVEAVGCAPGEILFLDDVPGNAAAGAAAGLDTIEVDLRDPGAAFAEARRRLGIEVAV